MNITTGKGRRIIAAALLTTVSSAVAVGALSLAPTAGAQILLRDTPSRAMDDCISNALKISPPGTSYSVIRESCCINLGGSWFGPGPQQSFGTCTFSDGSVWVGRPKPPASEPPSAAPLPPDVTNLN